VDFHVSWLGDRDVLGSSGLGQLLVVGSKRDADTRVVLGGNYRRSSILRKETPTDKVVSFEFMCDHNHKRADFIHPCRPTFFRIVPP
jgi:hypothetical protein